MDSSQQIRHKTNFEKEASREVKRREDQFLICYGLLKGYLSIVTYYINIYFNYF